MQDKDVTTAQVLTVKERAIKCAAFALDKKALDVKILEIKKISSIADYLVLASGRSDRQVQAIADSVKMGLKPFDKPIDMEGVEEGRWIVIDYGDIIVHVFQEEVRALYNLDELWGRAPQLEIPKEFLWEHK
jgi:ribosome-associated protein